MFRKSLSDQLQPHAGMIEGVTVMDFPETETERFGLFETPSSKPNRREHPV
jgi:hypothetical protein